MIGHLCASRFPSKVYCSCSFMPGQITNLTGQKAILRNLSDGRLLFTVDRNRGFDLRENVLLEYIEGQSNGARAAKA